MSLEYVMQNFCEPLSGKLEGKHIGDVMFVYDIHFGHSRDLWKGLTKEDNNEMGNDIHFSKSRDHYKGTLKEKNSENGLHHAFIHSVPETWPYRMKSQ